jgi:hypothetical protein
MNTLILPAAADRAHEADTGRGSAQRPESDQAGAAAPAIPGPAAAPVVEAAAGPVRLTRTVPRQYVHRAALAEVLLSDWRPAGPDRFLVDAQWPRAHSLYASMAGLRYDPFLFAETVRQAGLLLSHAAYAVPLDHSFLMWELHYTLDPAQVPVGPAPADWELEVQCQDRTDRNGRLSGMTYRVSLLREGAAVGVGGARFTCAGPRVYQRLRGGHGLTSALLPRPERDALPAEYVRATGRAADRDVVLEPAATPGGPWPLRVDPDHPVYFDHPVDHVPGMLLMDAARQAAALATGRPDGYPAQMSARFLRFVEFGESSEIRADAGTRGADGGTPVQVSAAQAGTGVFEADLVLCD